MANLLLEDGGRYLNASGQSVVIHQAYPGTFAPFQDENLCRYMVDGQFVDFFGGAAEHLNLVSSDNNSMG